jgi:cytoskeletal protein RodZ
MPSKQSERRHSAVVEENRLSAEPIEHPLVRHERSDADFRWILRIIIGALCFAVVALYSVWWFFVHYNDYQAAIKRSSFPLAATPRETLPSTPRLEQLNRMEGVETSNVYEREASKEDVLKRYGPTEEKGFVHIPIERAITKLLEDKLPTRKEPPPGDRKRENGLVDSGEPNSGRMFREKPLWHER